MAKPLFSPQTFAFLNALAANNDRAWFEAHKQDYETRVRGPALELIENMATILPSISPYFRAEARKVGGSLMRVQRDTRFSRDKTPYKTNIGIQFRHETGRDVHAPGLYLHIAPGECFVGVGLWRPDADALSGIRQAIVEHPEAWLAARDDANFCEFFSLEGDSLVHAPRGYAKDHPLLTDLKRKDFIGLSPLSEATVVSDDLLTQTAERLRAATPYMRFLCQALQLRF